MRKLHCSDGMMAAACAEIAAGLTDADLGSNLYKKRIPIEGRLMRRVMTGYILSFTA